MSITRAEFPLPDIDDPLVGPYFTAAARGELRIPRCETCDRFVWYPEPVCPTCAGPLGWQLVSGRGRLFTWAVVRRAFLPAFSDLVPFVTALVAIDEDPSVRLCSMLDAHPDRPTIGDAVEVTFRPLQFATVPDRSVVVPRFRPLREARP